MGKKFHLHLKLGAIVIFLLSAGETVLGDSSQESKSCKGSGSFYKLYAKGDYIYDSFGRVVLLRGVNVPAHQYKPLKFDSKDLEVINSFGFNFIRLGISWAKAEPYENVYDFEYLSSIVEFTKSARECGIYVMPEVHKFAWCSPGSQMPDWMCEKPAEKNLDFYRLLKEARRFWQDPSLQDKLINFWLVLDKELGSLENVFGYNPLNEPLDISCLMPGSFEKTLFSFYERWIKAIRLNNTQKVAVLEPCLFNVFLPMKPVPLYVKNIVYAPHPYFAHFYDNKGELVILERETMYGLKKKYRRIAKEAKELEAPLLIGEFGGPPEIEFTRKWVSKSLELQDKYFASSSIWVYDPSEGGWSIVDSKKAPKPFFWKNLRRPYPRYTAGKPIKLSYSPKDNKFSYSFSPDLNIKMPTEIYVPREMADGHIEVRGGIWSYDETSQIMLLKPFYETEEISVEIRRF